jgi:hypothetical protein
MSPNRKTNNAIVAVTICLRICGKNNHTTSTAAMAEKAAMAIQEIFDVLAISFYIKLKRQNTHLQINRVQGRTRLCNREKA